MPKHTRPTPRAVRILRTEVYANLHSVSSNLGGGGHGHLGMMMPAAEYTVISIGNAAYIPPAGPPQIPAFNGTAANVAMQQETYRRELQEWQEYLELRAQIKALILKAVPKSYTDPLASQQLGHANTTPTALMTYLMTKYGAIKDSDL